MPRFAPCGFKIISSAVRRRTSADKAAGLRQKPVAVSCRGRYSWNVGASPRTRGPLLKRRLSLLCDRSRNFSLKAWTNIGPLLVCRFPGAPSICQKFSEWERGRKTEGRLQKLFIALLFKTAAILQRSIEGGRRKTRVIVCWFSTGVFILWLRGWVFSHWIKAYCVGELLQSNPQTISTAHSAPVWWNGSEACRCSGFLMPSCILFSTFLIFFCSFIWSFCEASKCNLYNSEAKEKELICECNTKRGEHPGSPQEVLEVRLLNHPREKNAQNYRQIKAEDRSKYSPYCQHAHCMPLCTQEM